MQVWVKAPKFGILTRVPGISDSIWKQLSESLIQKSSITDIPYLCPETRGLQATLSVLGVTSNVSKTGWENQLPQAILGED